MRVYGLILSKIYHFWKLICALNKRIFYYPFAKYMFKKVGNNVYIGKKCKFFYKNILIGDDVYIGDNASFISSISEIKIGNHVMFGPHVTIRGGNHRVDVIGKYMKSITENEKIPDNDQDVIIEDDVWIGCNVTILKGVTVGRGSVIGAGSVVVKPIPPYSIYVGVPGKQTFSRFSEEQIIEHERILSNIM